MQEAGSPKLIFVGDPMCSWCYGFGKELSTIQERHPELTIEVRVGGVRAGDTQPMTDEMKRFRLGHWHRVEKASGLEFNRDAFMQLENFVYDTEPACRAAVAARLVAPGADQLSVFWAIQHAFYAQGRDTTSGQVLAEVVSQALAKQGMTASPQEVLQVWESADAINKTAQEFKEVRRWGISSFPTLLLQHSGEVALLAPGYMSADELESRLNYLIEA